MYTTELQQKYSKINATKHEIINAVFGFIKMFLHDLKLQDIGKALNIFVIIFILI